MIKKKQAFLLAAVFCFTIPCAVTAGTKKIVPLISFQQEYSDNILLSETNQEDDFITTGTAGLRIVHDSERLDARIEGKLKHLVYQDNDSLDTTNGSVKGSWNYRVSQRSALGASARYQKDSRRDRDTDTTGLVLSGDRHLARVLLSGDHMFSEKTQGKLGFGYSMTELEKDNIDEENDHMNLDLGFSKNLSETFQNTTGLLNFGYAQYNSDTETLFATGVESREFVSDVFRMSAGFSRNITELHSFYLQAGANYTQTEEERDIIFSSGGTIAFADQDSSTTGAVLSAGLNYDGLYWDAGLSISHDVTGASASNGTVERSALSLKLDRKVTENFFITLNTSFYRNKNDRESVADLDEQTFNARPGFRYRFTDTFVLSGYYKYTFTENREDDTDREQNLFSLLLYKEFDL